MEVHRDLFYYINHVLYISLINHNHFIEFYTHTQHYAQKRKQFCHSRKKWVNSLTEKKNKQIKID